MYVHSYSLHSIQFFSVIHLLVHTHTHTHPLPPSSPSDEISLLSPLFSLFYLCFRLLQIVFQNVFKMFFLQHSCKLPFQKIFSQMELDQSWIFKRPFKSKRSKTDLNSTSLFNSKGYYLAQRLIKLTTKKRKFPFFIRFCQATGMEMVGMVQPTYYHTCGIDLRSTVVLQSYGLNLNV